MFCLYYIDRLALHNTSQQDSLVAAYMCVCLLNCVCCVQDCCG